MADKNIALITGAGGGIGAGIAKTLSAEGYTVICVDKDAKKVEEVSKTIPGQRIGTPDDIGKAVSYLASDNASWVFGETLVVDGGGMA